MSDAALTPELAALVERMVAERVDAAIDDRLGPLQAALDDLSRRLSAGDAAADSASLLVFSGDLDRLLAAFIIAASAAAMGLKVSMYFTFWGLVALKKKTIFAGKSISEKMLAAFTPASPWAAGTSKLHMLGAGPVMLKSIMKTKNVETLPGLIATARELGVRFIACQMSMDIMGVLSDELIDGIEFAGAAAYVGEASSARLTLFI